MNNFQDKANFIRQVADDILRGAFKQHEYGDVILPFVVLRRMDCVLESTKDAVIDTYNKFKDKLPDPSPLVKEAAGNWEFGRPAKFITLRKYSNARCTLSIPG